MIRYMLDTDTCISLLKARPPVSKSSRRAGKFSSRSETCSSGRRWVCLRNKITEGRFSFLSANRLAKSVSAEIRIRSSSAARMKISASNADCRP